MRRTVHPWARASAPEVLRTTPRGVVHATGIRPGTNHRNKKPYKFQKTIFINKGFKGLKTLNAHDCVIALRILGHLNKEPLASTTDIYPAVSTQMNKNINAIPQQGTGKAESRLLVHYNTSEVKRVFGKMVDAKVLRYTGTRKDLPSRKGSAQKQAK